MTCLSDSFDYEVIQWKRDPYKNFSILFVFYAYHTYFDPILIFSRSILLLFCFY